MVVMSSFPEYILKDNCKILDLFCAAFEGRNTIQHVANITSSYTGIDNDSIKINLLRQKYSSNKFQFITADVYKIIDELKDTYDIVISDQWTNQNTKLYSIIGKILQRSLNYVIISTNIESLHMLPLSVNNFHLEAFWLRSAYLGGTYWAIFKNIT